MDCSESPDMSNASTAQLEALTLAPNPSLNCLLPRPIITIPNPDPHAKPNPNPKQPSGSDPNSNGGEGGGDSAPAEQKSGEKKEGEKIKKPAEKAKTEGKLEAKEGKNGSGAEEAKTDRKEARGSGAASARGRCDAGRLVRRRRATRAPFRSGKLLFFQPADVEVFWPVAVSQF